MIICSLYLIYVYIYIYIYPLYFICFHIYLLDLDCATESWMTASVHIVLASLMIIISDMLIATCVVAVCLHRRTSSSETCTNLKTSTCKT